MNRDQVRGLIDKAVGTAKCKAGELTDSPNLKLEGILQQAKGKVESAWGKTRETVRIAVDKTEANLKARTTLRRKKITTGAE